MSCLGAESPRADIYTPTCRTSSPLGRTAGLLLSSRPSWESWCPIDSKQIALTDQPRIRVNGNDLPSDSSLASFSPASLHKLVSLRCLPLHGDQQGNGLECG